MKYLFIPVLAFFLAQNSFAQTKKPASRPAPKKTNPNPTPKAEEPRKDNFAVLETQEVRFPGTDEELVVYFMKNVKFDSTAVNANAEGEVMLSFMVNPDSTVSNPNVLRKFGFGIDEQMVELVKQLKFVPAKMNGVITRSNHMISIPLRAYFQ